MTAVMDDHLLSTIEIGFERDVVLARRRTRHIAEVLGFDAQDRTRLATAVSEIARNAFQYGGGGTVEFLLLSRPSQRLQIRVTDQGPGIADLPAILAGQYSSATGMGLGIQGARRLTDRFEIDSRPSGGTTVLLEKVLPRRSPDPEVAIATLKVELGTSLSVDLVEEVQQQNQELLRTLQELRSRQTDIERLNQELEETNRGVVALYAELDERAQDLGRVADLRSRVLSDISHEVRTPLNAILNVTRLLIDRLDGELSPEQERQVKLIRDSARTLTELVTDLLELARMEAGKTTARVSQCSAMDLFAALRGMFRPLLNGAVALVLDDVSELPTLYTDEGKIGQILRNLISNAVKFTERGEIRVSAAIEGELVLFTVTDTGIGIAPEDHEKIFQEFSQVENPLQRRSHGSGLGLPLSRKLATFLGGTLTVRSAVGEGSTFTAAIPRVFEERQATTRRDVLPDKSPRRPEE